jgi:hypothetical protein
VRLAINRGRWLIGCLHTIEDWHEMHDSASDVIHVVEAD